MHFVEVNKSIIPQHLVAEIDGNDVVLHWQEATMALSYNVYRNGEKIAEGLTEPTYTDNEATAQESYSYTVTGETDFIESSHSNEAQADWTSLSEEMIGNQHIVVYPNPSHGQVHIEVQEEVVSCQVVDLIGNTVAVCQPVQQAFVMSLDNLSSGVYLLKLQMADGRMQFGKVVKQ
jgi:hypothetical protein